MYPSVHPVGLTALFTQLYIAVSIPVQPILHNRITSSKKLRDCHFNISCVCAGEHVSESL